ncbi:MAG: ribonuclease H-like domain-containing protein [Lachnospiraceae bacterium]|nr:ribonuclease H-like domain-containing protein [Lachnospiraceae bacterium]
MKVSRETLEEFDIEYDITRLAPPEELVFLDIETTGFTARSSYLYMIGCAYNSAGKWCTIQWLAETYEQEVDILNAFFDFVKDYKYLVHFNGNQFDMPYLIQKCKQHELDYNFESFTGIDLYKRISPCKVFLGLSNCKQKTMEKFLGIDRKDAFSGGELIGVYHDYVKDPSEFSRNTLLLHNEDDLKGMLSILPMLAYFDLFNNSVMVKRASANNYKDYNGATRQELILTAELPVTLPRPVSASANGCYFHGEGAEGSFRIPIYNEEMKYFYANYKDYYYLPEEDVALHKSVASFVNKEQRTQATAATCYTRKQSRYLPQFDILFEPIFRREYRSKEVFFELTDELKRDRAAFTEYANHILQVIGTTY